MKLEELSTLLNREDLKVKHKYDDKDKRLYLSGIDGFTVYLQELENNIIFVRVWKAWNKDNPKNKQEQKDLNGCKMVKFKVLKLLYKISQNIANNELNLEEMPTSPEEVNLSPTQTNSKSILDLDIWCIKTTKKEL